MYDPDARRQPGAFGLFFYPPPFALLVLPFALLPVEIGGAGLDRAARRRVRGRDLAAAGLGRGPAGRRSCSPRCRGRSSTRSSSARSARCSSCSSRSGGAGWTGRGRSGLPTGIGTVIKLQPALVIGWALVTGRRRAARRSRSVSWRRSRVVATVVAGPQPWLDESACSAGSASRSLTPTRASASGGSPSRRASAESLATLIHWANVAAGRARHAPSRCWRDARPSPRTSPW